MITINIKCLEIKLIKDVQDLCNGHYKTFLRAIKGDLNKWSGIFMD